MIIKIDILLILQNAVYFKFNKKETNYQQEIINRKLQYKKKIIGILTSFTLFLFITLFKPKL